jgi:serine-type D-Ala-D-Ala carboxypeptidase (penicillin-binding protein 5/6)
MTSLRVFSVRALALSLTLSATGALFVGGPLPASASASASASVSKPDNTAVGIPVGGQQLAARGVIVNRGPGVPAPPAMPGASFLLADMDTGQILAAKAPHAPHLPASTLKTLTALTLIPLLDPKSKIMVKPEDARAEGSHLGIVPGTAYSVETLLQGLLMVSGNDAAYALARSNHSIPTTLAEMNANAARLQALDTVAKDPSGLDSPGQQTSAYDLALIGRAAMKLPDFRRYVGTKRSSMPAGRSADGKRHAGFKIGSHNKLLYNYQGAIGIKTGYTIAAKQTYIGAATRGGKTYLVTQMASPNGSWRMPAALLDWAFAYGPSVTPVGSLVEPGAAPAPAPVQIPAPESGPAPVPAVRAEPALHGPAALVPREAALQPGLPTGWVIGAGGIGALALIAVRARPKLSRKPR